MPDENVQKPLKPVHERRNHHVPRDLVAQFLRWQNCNLFDHLFVGVEIKRQLGVILLNYQTGCLFHGLRPYSTLKQHSVNEGLA